MTQTPTDWLAFLDEVADGADEIALELFQHSGLRVDMKPDDSPVTEADRAIERLARRLVGNRFPGVGVYGEEEGDTSEGADRRLIIDPIDATRNFIRGIPIFASLLAIEVEGVVVAGVVSAPALGTRWRGARDTGSFRGHRPIAVSGISTLADAQLFYADLGGLAEPAPPGGLQRLARRVERNRGFGDFYQHVLVSEGAGEIAVDPGVSPWDIAAIQVIVEEAGGRATTTAGERTIYGGSLVCTNGALHDEVVAELCR